MNDPTSEDFAVVARDVGRLIGCILLVLAASSCAVGVAIGLGLQ